MFWHVAGFCGCNPSRLDLSRVGVEHQRRTEVLIGVDLSALRDVVRGSISVRVDHGLPRIANIGAAIPRF